MRRQEIRDAVDDALAELGYSRGWYSWNGCELRIASRTGAPMYSARYPSGLSRKRLDAALSLIERNGPARTVTRQPIEPRMRQTHIEEFIGA